MTAATIVLSACAADDRVICQQPGAQLGACAEIDDADSCHSAGGVCSGNSTCVELGGQSIGGRCPHPEVCCTPSEQRHMRLRARVIQFESDTTKFRHDGFNQLADTGVRSASYGLVGLDIVEAIALPYPPQSLDHDYDSIAVIAPNVLAEDRPRLWWYYQHNGRTRIVGEIDRLLTEARTAGTVGAADVDLTIVVTDAQFEAIAFYSHFADESPVVVLNSWSVGGWSKVGAEAYNRRKLSNIELVEENNHELGHYLGLSHACATACDGAELELCCQACAARDDVMSYCRDRLRVRDTGQLNRFGRCTRQQIIEHSIPRFLRNERTDSPRLRSCD